jgi:hypothetical protein
VLIEHVSPVRDFTRRAIEKVDKLDDDGFALFVKNSFPTCAVDARRNHPTEPTEPIQNER